MRIEINNRILSGFILWMMVVSSVLVPMMSIMVGSVQGNGVQKVPLQNGGIVTDFNIIKDSWVNITDIPTSRVNFGASVINKNLYCLGGWDGFSPYAINEMYNFKSKIWINKTPMPIAKEWFATVSLNNLIYTIGGWTSSPVATMDEYNAFKDTWQSKTPMNVARTGLTANVVFEKIYTIGGNTGATPDTTVSTVEEYNTFTNNWVVKNNKSIPVTRTASVVYNNHILVFGGFDKFGNPASIIEAYDPITDTWEYVGDMPEGLYDHCANIIGNLVFISGGWNGTVRSDLFVYDIKTNEWWKGKNMITPRKEHCSVVYNGKLFAISGNPNGFPYTNTIEEYTPNTITFSNPNPSVGEQITINTKIYNNGNATGNTSVKFWMGDPTIGKWINMNSFNKPSPREYHEMSLIYNDDKVVMYGGWDTISGGGLNETWAYDLSDNQWINKSPLIQPPWRSMFSMATFHNSDKILLFGGTYGQYYNDTWIYNLSDNNWVTKNPLNAPPLMERHAMAPIYNDDKIVLFGGNKPGVIDHNETWVYDLSENNWTKKSPIIKPSARHWHTMAPIYNDDKIVLFGGYEAINGLNNETWVYDLSEDKWTNKNLFKAPCPRQNHAMATIYHENKVLLFGGDNGITAYDNETWTYDLDNNKWIKEEPLTKPSARDHHAMSTIYNENKILLFGAHYINNETWIYQYEESNAVQIGITKHINQLLPGNNITVSVNFTPTELKDYDIFVTVENCTPADINLSNNIAFKILTVAAPDLSISSEDITFSNPTPSPSEEITVSATIENTGTISGSAKVKFWDRDPEAESEWILKTNMPTARCGLTSATVDNKIYVIGGNYNDGSWHWLSTVEEYDSLNNTWSTKTSMPTGRTTLDCIAVDNKIYAIGGSNSPSGNVFANNEVYNPLTDNWTTKAPMLTPRNWLGVGALNNKIYAIGGSNNQGGSYNINEEYDITTDNWTIKAPMPTSRLGPGVAVVNNKIYAIGGWLGHTTTLVSTNEVYDPATNTWETKAPLPAPANMMGITVKDNKIYVIGGCRNTYNNYGTTVNVFDPVINEWVTIKPLNVARQILTASVANSKIYAIGGLTNEYLATVEEYTPTAINATLIGEKTITNLAPGTNITVNTLWQVPFVPGNYSVFVTIEDSNPLDSNMSNNKAESDNITITGSAPNAPEISISPSGIYFSNDQPNDGDTVRIYAKIWNNGLVDVTSANVTFWDGDPQSGGVFIDNVISQFASGYMTVRFVDWKATAGNHTIYVWIKDIIPSDANLANNKAYTTISVNQKPILVKALPDVLFDEDTTLYNAFDLDEYFSDTSYVGLGVGKDHQQLTIENVAQRYPSFSPDGTTIIYDSIEDSGSYRDIWSMDSEGKNRVQLTSEDYHQEQPNYSPDGLKIVYASYEDGDNWSDIWLMDADGTNHVQLTNDSYNQSAPKFSPDGTKIVYYSKEDGGLYFDIWMLERNGATWNGTCTHTQITNDPTTQYNPVFSIDGARIAFEDDVGSPGTWNVWTMNNTGGDRLQLTANGGRGPLYSPDGLKVIYFSQADGSSYWDVWLMTVDGTDHTQLTTEQADQLYGCFSPDGSKIAYDSNEDGGADIDIWIMNFYQDTLEYSYYGNTHVHVTINDNRTVDFSADLNLYGSENITFRATDTYGYYVEDTILVTVNPVNDAPIVIDIPDMMFGEDQSNSNLDLDYFVSDIDNANAELTWTYSGNINVYVSINAATHVVTFTAKQNWSGQETVFFNATDPGGLYDVDAVVVNVTAVNDQPQILGIPDVQFDEDEYYDSLDLDDYVLDVDNVNSDLIWNCLGTYKINVTINQTTHIANFTAEENWYGQEQVTFKVQDPTLLWDICTITVTVNPVNDQPVVIGPIIDFSMDEDENYTLINLSNVFFDVDNDALQYSVKGDVNINVTINPDGSVILEPEKDWFGDEILIFNATDGITQPVTDTVKVTVDPVNDPPEIDSAPLQQYLSQQSIYEDEDFILDMTQFIVDIDNENSNLVITEDSQHATVSGQKIILNYPNGVVSDTINITVSDGEYNIVVTVTVSIIPVNDKPELETIADIVVNEGETIIITPKASDVDNDENDLIFTISGDMTTWVWSTDYKDGGVYKVNVSVTDGELDDWQDVKITINDVPQPPIIDPPIPNQVVNESEPFTLDVTAWDWDDDTLTYYLDSAPLGMTINATTGIITWTPSWVQVGEHLVTVKVSDGMFDTTDEFKVTVLNVNDAPVLNYMYYTGISAYYDEEINITLRITGTKYMAVSMGLYKNNILIKKENVTRLPGCPNEQILTMNTILDLDDDNSLILEYVADRLGATPVKLTISYGENNIVIHHTFNAMNGEIKEVVYDLSAEIKNNPGTDKTVRFDASSSYDPDGDIVKYFWDFGDGSTSTSKDVTYEYKKIGRYDVTLIITDNDGETNETTFRVNPSFKTILLPEEGGTYVPDLNITGEAQITALYVSNPSKVTDTTIGIYVDYTITGEGTLNWIIISIEYSEDDLPEGMDESELRLFWWDEINEVWVMCENTTVDTENNIVSANVTHFTIFAPLSQSSPTSAKASSAGLPIWLLPVGIVGGLLSGIAIAAFIAGVEVILVAILFALTPLLSYVGKRKDRNKMRRKIYATIVAKPGIHYYGIKNFLELSNGVCAYHLHQLEKDEMVKSKRDGKLRRFYPIEKGFDSISPPLAKIQFEISELIRDNPGASQKELKYLTGLSKQKINYHVKKLETKGIITMEKDRSGHTLCYIADDIKKLEKMPSKKNNIGNEPEDLPTPQWQSGDYFKLQ